MNEIIEECKKLNQMLADSKEYKNYVFAESSLRANEELYNSLQEFKSRYADILKYTDGNPYDEILRMYYENDELIHNSTVNEFLRAESSLSKMIKDIIAEITDGLKI
ncbi:MAG: YlbF family regulator [Eubacterium sp.]|nr:YlbF family regulator [Eubacterium sp.]